MCGMRQADYGQVPVQRAGPSLARGLRALLRLPESTAGEVLLEGGQALLQERLLQVSSATPRIYNSLTRALLPSSFLADLIGVLVFLYYIYIYASGDRYREIRLEAMSRARILSFFFIFVCTRAVKLRLYRCDSGIVI